LIFWHSGLQRFRIWTGALWQDSLTDANKIAQIEETHALTAFTQAAAIGVLQSLHLGDIFPA